MSSYLDVLNWSTYGLFGAVQEEMSSRQLEKWCVWKTVSNFIAVRGSTTRQAGQALRLESSVAGRSSGVKLGSEM